MPNYAIDRNVNRYAVKCSSPLKQAIRYLNDKKLRILLCIEDDGRLAGVLTPGDINRWLIADGNHSLNVDVGKVCSSNPRYVRQGFDAARLEQFLQEVAYVPILDVESRLVALAMRRHLKEGIWIGDYEISETSPSYIIAEIGNNHNGSLDFAKRLIDHAKESGANCAKFQMRDLSSLYANAGNANDEKENLGSQYTLDLLRRFQLTPDELFQAFDHCRNVGLEPLCTPWDKESVVQLEEYGLSAYKVASADLTNHQLLQVLVETGKPLICSTGMSHEHEIHQAVDLLQSHGGSYILLHCNSTYPAPFKDIHLSYMTRLKELGECPVGYSGHERDIFVSVAAVAHGAAVIEKHFTLDRSMEGNDHKVSLLPNEFARMVEGIRQVEAAMGVSASREMSQGEMMNRVTLAKSVFINCDITAGTTIQSGMLEVKSPGHGLQPNRILELIGRPANRTMTSGDVFYPGDLEEHAPQAREYHFNSEWGVPVRHHDFQQLLKVTNPQLLEFHLSYKDLELEHQTFFSDELPVRLVVHAPELFAHDHTLDLAAPDGVYRKKSISEMKRVIEVTKQLKRYFSNADEPIGIITNVGGFSMDAPLSPDERVERLEHLEESLHILRDEAVEIWPQTMPPFPWHFGGQRYHNLFVDAEEIVEFCRKMGIRVCLDISHSKLACNHLHISFQWFLEQVLPYTAHLHIADAKGVDGEGLQIDEGDIDFYALAEDMNKYAPDASWIPEIWQGHENNGEGFWKAFELLEKQGY